MVGICCVAGAHLADEKCCTFKSQWHGLWWRNPIYTLLNSLTIMMNVFGHNGLRKFLKRWFLVHILVYYTHLSVIYRYQCIHSDNMLYLSANFIAIMCFFDKPFWYNYTIISAFLPRFLLSDEQIYHI